MPFVDTEHGKLHYKVKGQGQTLVMIHGLSRNSEYWHGFDHQLSKNFQIITLDPRGMGKSDHRLGWFVSVPELAFDVTLILDQLKVKDAHILGLSLGGMIALAFASLYPDRVLSLFIINSSAGGFGSMRITPKSVQEIALGMIFPSSLPDQIMKIASGKHIEKKRKEKIRKEWKKISDRDGVPYIPTLKQLFAAIRFHKKVGLEDIQAPTTIAYGSGDRFVPFKNSKELAHAIPQARLVVIPGAGHEISLDHPEELLGVIYDHMQVFQSDETSL